MPDIWSDYVRIHCTDELKAFFEAHEEIKSYADFLSWQADREKAWKEEQEEKGKASTLFPLEPLPLPPHITDDIEEDYYQHEHEWMSEGGEFYWKIKAFLTLPEDISNDTGEPEVTLQAYLCLDSYGRDYIGWLAPLGGNPNQSTGPSDITLPISELTPEKVDALARQAVEGLSSL
jgi:hypothetical protein